MKNSKVKALIDDNRDFGGQFVATFSFKDRKVVAYGFDRQKVIKEAKENGAERPVIIFVPPKDQLFCFPSIINVK